MAALPTTSPTLEELPNKCEVKCALETSDDTPKHREVDGENHWQKLWGLGEIGFHQPIVNEILKKELQLLSGEERHTKKVLVPLCGKTLDMKWLAMEGHTVIGVDVVKKALEEFCREQDFNWSEEDAPTMGEGCHRIQPNVENIRFYRGDVMLFNESVEGQFDVIWDRAAMVALNRGEEVKRYTNVMKNLIRPDGRMILETVEYDVSIMDGEPYTPPPFPMLQSELHSMFGSKFTVDLLEKKDHKLCGKDIKVAYYRISKNVSIDHAV